MPPHHIGSGVRSKNSERLVIVSQTCDIARDTTVEPTVLAARAFYTGNQSQIALARNSTRYFVLEDELGLIVDMTEMSIIEKPLLARIVPQQPNASEAKLREFALWLGDRFSRPAYSDDFHKYILKPFYSNIEAMVKAGDPRTLFLQSRGIALRIVPPSETAPFDLRIFALMPADDPEGNALELGLIKAIAEIQPEIFAGIDARYLGDAPSITPIRFDQISAQEFLDLDPLRFSRVLP